jgi:hypothetical protein
MTKITEPIEKKSTPIASVSIADRVGELIDQLETSNKPWFLQSTEIYKAAKDAATNIPYGSVLFDQSLAAVSLLTKNIQENTNLKVAVDVEDSHDLLVQLDTVLAQQLVVVDDGLDHLRARLAISLRQLMSAIVIRKNWAENYATQATKSTASGVRTRFEYALDVLKSLLSMVNENYSGVVSGVQDVAHRVEVTGRDMLLRSKQMATATAGNATKWIETGKLQATGVYAVAFWLLHAAQPSIRAGVTKYRPYVAHAIEASQSYGEKAKPYVDPLLNRAKELSQSVLENQLLGPFVAKAYEAGNLLVEETKAYCLPPDHLAPQTAP